MREIYRHRDHARVGLLESLLKSEGIEVFLRNRNLTMSGLSEIPIPEFYPALCVVHPEDEKRAVELVKDYLARENEPLGEDWICSACGEKVPDSLAECWQCQGQRG
ncbi:DUF2007 domain-containing protein [Roseibacillus ishigakijimensis]|uniref:DUF2007 domain-containing protein n=1 Tax=Roseibacillus ishigakijimensis TaxID=454146 RepID=A0A934VM47_9BACT|nr:DUF2007 domain-containing protein [Roseibacillus ishigakijimensis]MBK1833897.1 DUF2007 domain-containing protein [Roseibacillus ishigakijimensis]